MASEESSSSAAATASSSSSSASAADSYIGSVISLTSKSEIRYEGILVSINPQESTIALQNVRSYGTEGRKKDGPQVPPNDKVYEYILFRGSDIKDLQVKSSSSIPAKPQPHSDPAIIQSHYAYKPAAYTTSASGGGGSLRGQAVHPSLHPDLARQSIPDSISLNQTGANLGSSVSSPTPTYTNGSSFTTPMYSQGYFGSLSGQAHALQQSVPLQSQPVIMQNQLQYPEGYTPRGMPNLPGLASPLTFSSAASPSQFSISNPAYSPMLSSSSSSSIPSSSSSLSSYLAAPPLTSSNQDLNSNDMILGKAGPSRASFFSVPSLPLSSSVLGPASGPITTFPPLLTPDQLTMSTTNAPFQKLYPEPKEMMALLPSSATSLSSACALPQAPLLPLPTPPQQGGFGTKFTEEFDFTTMNEKFNKDEVWGSLGKGKPSGTTGDGTEDDPVHDNIEVQEGFAQDPKSGTRPVYNKDDFFDTLSCNSLNRGGWTGRTKFSDRMKLDTETFGEFQQRPPLGRGNPGNPHYGNFRGSYNRGRGYGHYGGRGHGGYRPM